MKLVIDTKLFVDLTNIMVVHIMNNEIGCFNQFVLRENPCSRQGRGGAGDSQDTVTGDWPLANSCPSVVGLP